MSREYKDFWIEPVEDEENAYSCIMENYNFIKALQLYNRPIEETYEDDDIAACSTTCPACGEKVRFVFYKGLFWHWIFHEDYESDCNIDYIAFCHELFSQVCPKTPSTPMSPVEVFSPQGIPAYIDNIDISRFPRLIRAKALKCLQGKNSVLQWLSAKDMACKNIDYSSIKGIEHHSLQFKKTDLFYGYILQAQYCPKEEHIRLDIAIGYGVIVDVYCPCPKIQNFENNDVIINAIERNFGQSLCPSKVSFSCILNKLRTLPVKIFASNNIELDGDFKGTDIILFRFIDAVELQMLEFAAEIMKETEEKTLRGNDQ